jgi:hypothetical protein
MILLPDIYALMYDVDSDQFFLSSFFQIKTGKTRHVHVNQRVVVVLLLIMPELLGISARRK